MTHDKIATSLCIVIAFLFLSTSPALAASSGNVVNVPAAPPPTGAVIGGEAAQPADDADGNTVNVNYDVAIPSRNEGLDISVVGGFAKGPGFASNNTVNIEAATTDGAVIGGYVYSNDTTLNLFGGADNNSVTITNATIGGPVYGGYNNYTVDNVGSEPNSATNNTVVITGGSVDGDVTGGRSYDGYKAANPTLSRSAEGSADNNSVTIDGAAVIDGTVTGGDSYANAIGNTVTLKNGTILGDVIGGNGENYHSGGSRFESQNNTINLYSGSITGSVLGSGIVGNGDDKPFFGNTLNVYGQRWTVAQVNMFENYNFVLPADVADNPTPIFTVTTLTPTNLYNTFDENGNVPTDGTTSVLNSASILGGGSNLSDGQEIVLISQVTTDSNTYYATQDHVPVQQGFSNMYDMIAEINSTDQWVLRANGGPTLLGQTETPGQSIIGNLSNINLAADLAAGAGLELAEAACYRQKRVWRTFATADYGDFRYKHRGSLDSRAFTSLAGLAYSPSDNLTLGAFFEFGHGNFDSRNRADGRSIRSDGDATHTGGGILARWSNIGGTGLHLSGSMRIGYIRGEFDSSDLTGASASGNRAGFTTKGTYLGAHIGLGYRLDLTSRLNLHLDTKYLWNQAPGEDVSLFGERIRLEDLNSHRLKTGGKFIWKATERVRPYAGGWYEYEFDGKAKSRSITTGQAFRSSELKGSTGVGDLGVEFRPYGEVDCPRALIDLSVSGHVGRRKGISGQARFQWMF